MKQRTREQILETAKTRLSHFGFNKTKMVETVKACNIPTTNIYRHCNDRNERDGGHYLPETI